jgi:hypothetical protein
VLETFLAPGNFYQATPHGLCRRGEETGPVMKLRPIELTEVADAALRTASSLAFRVVSRLCFNSATLSSRGLGSNKSANSALQLPPSSWSRRKAIPILLLAVFPSSPFAVQVAFILTGQYP